MMTLGWLWFFLALGLSLMLSAIQQLVPESRALWEALFVAGFAICAGALAAYLISDNRQRSHPKS